ncbi:intercellular adhesin biosynthesis polysaccharide N-deacetylase [Staphylococcus edaphicus]|uniref:Poly-beta-1,6-N-acetyl-D-glucosamine N-deacetylase n=1 Tax=Staphylococcus edaphicus TaxID=1955013 RepID=A0ABY4QE22_9STAP|nr:intercellular adhesin biosynthesis polysaccharide N-deacetylase [Staphylococcus edaphicus]UQW81677.1 intercellular adhesin biosynthesis polysaccharide N-deacetylase [Staphylococcus edaphicus]
MTINIKKIYVLLIIVVSIIVISTKEKTYAKAKELKFEENSALALNYHRIRSDDILEKILFYGSNSKELKMYSVSEQNFEKQIKWLKSHHAHFLTEKEFLHYKEKGKFPKRSVWINFDDMDTSIYEHAHPILKKYNVPATGFVITDRVGTKNFHNLNLLSLTQLSAMKKSGLWEFRSHTSNLHQFNKNTSAMTETNTFNLSKDIKQSNDYLKKHLSEKNHSLAYPYGQISDQNIKAFKQADIKYGYTLEDSAVTPKDNNYYIPRILINDDAFDELIRNWKGFNDE